jgi:hypothetical protein
MSPLLSRWKHPLFSRSRLEDSEGPFCLRSGNIRSQTHRSGGWSQSSNARNANFSKVPAPGPGERALTRFSESLGRFAPKEAEKHGVGWAIQNGPRELKEEAHGPRRCARKLSLGSAGGFPRQD